MIRWHPGRLTLLPLWATILFFSLYLTLDLMRDRAQTEAHASQIATSYGRLVEEHASATLERTYRLLDDAVALAGRSGGDMAGLERALGAMQRRTAGVVSMTVTDAQGTVLANTVGVPPGGSLGDRSYFMALKAQNDDQPVVSELIKGRVSQKWGIQVARALRTPKGAFAGMIVANVGMTEYFAPFYGSLSLSDGMAISLWDLSSRVLVRYPEVDGVVGQIRPIPVVNDQLARGLEAGVVVTLSPIDGQMRTIAYRRLANSPIVAIVAIAEAEYLAGWHVARLRAIVAIVIIWAGGLLASLSAWRSKQAAAALEVARDQALAAQARAENASNARSRFLAAASHDLRQPVQSLLLLIEVIRNATAGTPLEKVAVQMDRSLDALRMLLNSLLDISKLDAGVLQPVFEEVDLGAMLSRLAEEYAMRAHDLGIELRAVVPHCAVHTDATLLERLLRNLVENALRYTPAGKVLIGCRRVGRNLRIDVVDTGIGIPEDQLEIIFDEFHQVGNPERDRSQGLGLGLAIVRRIADMLGCRMEVASEVGRGSRFSLVMTAQWCEYLHSNTVLA